MRKRWLTVGLVVLAAAISGEAPAGSAPPAPGTAAKQDAAQPPVVGVDALMQAPEKYPGTIRVQGMVRKVFLKEHRLGLLDAARAGCCSTPCESEKLLPVTWSGTMPLVRSMVLVTGETRKAGGAFEFAASGVEAVPDEPAPAR